ncbi:MAG: class I SAM-dependent methyltransferase [Flavobacteriaceae bacterium]|nr:class I SAM-dependent methyltransferase [Flavobacteriaceae bacterium]
MNLNLLRPEVQAYLDKHLQTDAKVFAMMSSPFSDLSAIDLTTQLASKQKCKSKLPSWFEAKNIYFPKSVHIEQTSSETTARYKSSIVKGQTLVDISGGFGVDSYYFSQSMERVLHFEWNEKLSRIARHNFKQLGAHSIETNSGNGLEYLQYSKERYDWIYIDPSRRSQQKGKVFLLEDCEPNLVEIQDLLFQKSAKVLVKTAPFLDLKAGASVFHFVKKIHIVAVQNEVKEILWELDKNFSGQTKITAVNLNREKTDTIESLWPIQNLGMVSFSLPKTYLYEPNAAIHKAQLYPEIISQYDLFKIAPDSHLFTSNERIDFPGRSFEVIDYFPYNKQHMKKWRKSKANITTRNFKLSVAQLRKKHQIKDGGDSYLFFTTNKDQKAIVLLCKKIQATLGE